MAAGWKGRSFERPYLRLSATSAGPGAILGGWKFAKEQERCLGAWRSFQEAHQAEREIQLRSDKADLFLSTLSESLFTSATPAATTTTIRKQLHIFSVLFLTKLVLSFDSFLSV